MKTVLLVDDQIDIQSLIADVLRNHGIKVEAAADGAEAVEILKQKSFDLIITDLKMPNIDGFSLIYKAKNTILNSENIPILVITGGGESFDFNVSLEGIQESGIAVLKKPFNKQQLLDAVCNVFGVNSLEELITV